MLNDDMYVDGVPDFHQAPTRILTCHHVVSEGTELNDGPVSFGIARRTEEANEIDTRRATWGWIKAKHLQFKPEYDMAILEVEPQANPQVAEKLHLTRSRPLHLNLDESRRAIGSLEVDKLFIPGASGSPILNAQTMEVIGYVHGYRTFALSSNVEVVEDVEIGEQSELKKQKLKYRLPLVTSLSLGIDLRTAERFCVDEGYVAK
jgi:V8-like Glu-specific endopeptidase